MTGPAEAPTTRPSVIPLTATIGAEVAGIDLAAAIDDATTMADVRQAFLDHHVLVFRNQELDRAQHKALGRCFGELHVHPSNRRAGVIDPEIFVVEAGPDTVLNNGGLWHSDVSCDERPPLGSMLLLTDAPPSGGDTLFANMHLAYELLSPPIRALLDPLTAVHDQRRDLLRYGYELRPGVDYPTAVHPVVIAHPDTGRPALFVNPAFTTRIEGLRPDESEAVLAMLHANVAGSPQLQCRVRWEPGTLVFWDNRCTQHYAVWDYHPAHRRGERVTIAAADRPRPALRAGEGPAPRASSPPSGGAPEG